LPELSKTIKRSFWQTHTVGYFRTRTYFDDSKTVIEIEEKLLLKVAPFG
jgi:hypothetical protein